ncbi:hypothetical protein E4U42_004634 [Claviceps africana]|uniref:Uncharacterized protein n=1 Tax=Claviceps africana TaxID=83212 RepID=A0A8K0J4V4_9HYPO|nr:hypothetical protein E4U42_004634 [Claviceps africana]
MVPRHTRVVRPDDSYWAELDNDNVPQPLDALGLSDLSVNGPHRYAVQRGRIVPQRHCVDVVLLPSQNEFGSIRSKIAPPRRSSRRSRQRERRKSASAWRPASSVYSHSDGELSSPTPEYTLASSDSLGGLAALQISPPSSPDLAGAAQRLDAGDVSPIEDDFDHVQHSALANRSHLDSRITPSQQRILSIPKTAQAEDHHRNAVPPPRRHDITPPDERAGYRQVQTWQAINYPENGALSRDAFGAGQLYGSQTTISAAANDSAKSSSSSSFSQRMRLMGMAKPAAFSRRPPWNGASGRSVVVQPVRDDLNVAPLKIVKQRAPGHTETSEASSIGTETSTTSTGGRAMRRLLQGSSKNKQKGAPAHADAQLSAEKQCATSESTYPTLPNIEILAQEAGPLYGAPSNDLQTQALGSHPFDLFRPSLNVIRRKPAPASSNASPASNHKHSDMGISNGIAESAGEAGGGDLMTAQMAPSDSPTEAASSAPVLSRFSFTTYATSDPGTSRLSTEETVTPLPVLGVMDRSRPVAGGRSRSSGSQQPIAIDMSIPFLSMREPQQQQGASANRRSQGPQNRSVSDTTPADRDRPSSRLSMSKPLPLAPHQGKSGDLVSQLDAQTSALFHRRVNIEKSIKQITELMPRDNLLASEHVLRKRDEEKQKVDNLRQELADIQREEHELGLKLYRARKRQEKEADFESTPLWVSRVAG